MGVYIRSDYRVSFEISSIKEEVELSQFWEVRNEGTRSRPHAIEGLFCEDWVTPKMLRKCCQRPTHSAATLNSISPFHNSLQRADASPAITR